MRRILLLMLVLLVAYGGLVFWLPETTVSPGDLVEGHASIAASCFQCHTAFRGTPSEKCLACHALAAIGLASTTGAPLARAERMPRFHQALLDPACDACHSDHVGTGRPGANARFTHERLRPDVLTECGDCHGDAAPADDLHRSAPKTCGSCHRVEGWTPATFDHAALGATPEQRCITCHAGVRPGDGLHRQAGDDCAGCHGTTAWKPATFEHAKYFRFDRHHPADPCQSCHPDSLDRYTCYGCHEHTPQGIAREHREEGITDFEDCARCHRSGDEDDAERSRPRSRGARSRDDD